MAIGGPMCKMQMPLQIRGAGISRQTPRYVQLCEYSSTDTPLFTQCGFLYITVLF